MIERSDPFNWKTGTTHSDNSHIIIFWIENFHVKNTAYVTLLKITLLVVC